MELEYFLSHLTHLRRLLFFGWFDSRSSSFNVRCIVLCRICIPVSFSIIHSRFAASLFLILYAGNIVECSLRPARPFCGLPIGARYMTFSCVFLDLDPCFLIQYVDMSMTYAISFVVNPLHFWNMTQFTLTSSSLPIAHILLLPICCHEALRILSHMCHHFM